MGHLARRFVSSLWPGGPGGADDAWARSFLGAGEQQLWDRMSGPDQRHAIAVARRFIASGHTASGHTVTGHTGTGHTVTGHTGTGPLAGLPAALLHDVGKVDAGLGPIGRAAVTAAAMAVGRDRIARGRGRAARYLRHDAIGADLLTAAGSDRLTSTWAREHHLPADRWTVALTLATALKAADDD